MSTLPYGLGRRGRDPNRKEFVNAVKSLPRQGVGVISSCKMTGGSLTLGNDKIRQALCCHEFMNSRILGFLKPTHKDLTEAALLWSFLRFTRRRTSRKEGPIGFSTPMAKLLATNNQAQMLPELFLSLSFQTTCISWWGASFNIEKWAKPVHGADGI